MVRRRAAAGALPPSSATLLERSAPRSPRAIAAGAVLTRSRHAPVWTQTLPSSEVHGISFFLALLLPAEVEFELAAWGRRHLDRARRLDSFHVTARLPRFSTEPRARTIVGVLRECTVAAAARSRSRPIAPARRSPSRCWSAGPERRGDTSRGALPQASSPSACTSARRDRGLRTSRCCGSTCGRDCLRPCRRSRRSLPVRSGCFAFTSAPDGCAVRGPRKMLARDVMVLAGSTFSEMSSGGRVTR